MTLAQHWSHLVCAPLCLADLDAVLALETSVYPHPWSSNNFIDSLASGYETAVLRDQDGSLAGYFLMLPILDEAHLLNLAVAAKLQGRGLGRFLLDQMRARAQDLGMCSVLLEVRPSNSRALDLYRRYGFLEIGRRKAYYPAHAGQREDAIVLRFTL